MSQIPSSSHAQDCEAHRLKQAVQELQGVFFNEVLKVARETIPEDDNFHLGLGGDIFSGMLDERIADLMSAQMDSQVTEAIYRQLTAGLRSRHEDHCTAESDYA